MMMATTASFLPSHRLGPPLDRSSMGSMNLPPGAGPSSSPPLGASMMQDCVESAANLVDQALYADLCYLDLADQMQVNKHNQPTVSGLMDFDYPSLGDPKIGLSSVKELSDIKKVPLPAELVEQFSHMQCNCLMGLFPEITRAWLSIDSDIFVWNYEDGSDLAYFDGLRETILAASLVTPKSGIFQPHIQYLLVLATAVDIVLLGVSFSKPYEVSPDEWGVGEMHLLPEPLFSVPTDNTHFMTIVGTDSGRIMMAGKDGCLYELAYQATDGWFSRKCHKINHSTSRLAFMLPSFLNFSFVEDDSVVQISIDNSRHILYMRSEKGSIQVYDLDESGNGMSRVAAISHDTLLQNASLIAKTIDRANFKRIVYIAAVSKRDSINVHLVAVTQTGVRLYMTTTNIHQPQARPSMLVLMHIRLPPGFSASAAPQRPKDVHIAHYRKGTLLLAGAQSDENDLLWTITSDSFPFQAQLRETHEVTAIDGRMWAIAEVPLWKCEPEVKTNQQVEAPPRSEPPTVVTQQMEPVRKFVIINSQGSYLLTKQRPVDQLRQLLLTAGADSGDVKAFFKLHREQACATCLILACSSAMIDRQVSEMATRAFFLYGGEPEYNFNTSAIGPMGPMGAVAPTPIAAHSPYMSGAAYFGSPQPGMQPAHASTPLPNVTQQLQFSSPSPRQHLPGATPEVIFSGKHRGLCLYLARILRPLWMNTLVTDLPVGSDKKRYFVSSVPSEQLYWILSRLTSLQRFLHSNSQLASTVLTESFLGAHGSQQRAPGIRADGMLDEQARRKFQAEAESREHASLKQLQQLVTQLCESLSLWKILTDHQFHVLAASLSADEQNALRLMSFRTYVTVGREMSAALIQSLINLYLDDNAAMDAISRRLREVCPSIYSTEDAICSKANEQLQLAKSSQSVLDRQKHLDEALALFRDISFDVDLPNVCNQFSALRFYTGIVDLTLTAAIRRDPQGRALHFYKNGEPQDDSQGILAYNNRLDCYKCITETLDYLLSISESHPNAPSVPKYPGPAPVTDPNRLSKLEAEQYAEEVFTRSLKSDDEMFHMALYDWLISESLSEKLLQVQTPYLETYLKRAATLHPDHLAMLDLLWRHYEKTRNYSAAARILVKQAERHGSEVSLSQRIEYLSRAAMCAKSTPTLPASTAPHGEFLHELEEKMEVASLQLQIFEKLSKMKDAQLHDVLTALNSQLMDITTLYGDFADRFQLSDCKLAIIQCAGHHDPTLVESLWRDIIDTELESSARQDDLTKVHALSSKLISLGKLYCNTEKYFPLVFLVKYLEVKSCQLGLYAADPRFTVTIFTEIGISVSRLHDVYDRLYKSKDPCWKALRRPLHLLQVIHQLLTTFVESANAIAAYDRRHFTTVALDAVSGYLVALQADSAQEDDSRQLMCQFRELQAKLERFV